MLFAKGISTKRKNGIWTRAADSISNDYNHYAKCAAILFYFFFFFFFFLKWNPQLSYNIAFIKLFLRPTFMWVRECKIFFFKFTTDVLEQFLEWI